MKRNQSILMGMLLFLFFGCSYENAVDLYYKGGEIKPVSTNGLLVNIPFDKKVSDISDNKMAVSLQGEATFVTGVDGKDSSAIKLQGYPQCITISNVGFNDTLSIFLWFKADELLKKTDSLTLFDYGVNSFSLQIDGSTGSTLIEAAHNDQPTTIADWINSFNTWNYLYAEAGGGKLKVMYRGEMKNKQPITIDTESESLGIINPLIDVLYIGRSGAGSKVNQSYFKGSIDNIRIFKRSLTKAEVLSFVAEDTKK